MQHFKEEIAQVKSDAIDKRKLAFLGHEELYQKTKEVLFNVLPQYWDSLCLVEDRQGQGLSSISERDLYTRKVFKLSNMVRQTVAARKVDVPILSTEDSALAEASKEMDDGEKHLASFNGVWLGGSPEHHTYSGIDMQALPSLRLQAWEKRQYVWVHYFHLCIQDCFVMF